jgi:hypothetical protein
MTSITSAPLQSAHDVLVVRVEGLNAQKGTTGQFARPKRYPRGGAAAERDQSQRLAARRSGQQNEEALGSSRPRPRH